LAARIQLAALLSGVLALAGLTPIPAAASGSIVAWGHNFNGECDVPPPNLEFAQVAAGLGHSLGLTTAGAIVAWGSDGSGQCTVPEPNASFVRIAAGKAHSLGLKADGSVVAWGWNQWHQCEVPAPNTQFIALAAGGLHSLGVRSDGTVVAWGANISGICTVPPPNADFVGVAAGELHSLGIKSDGTVVGWGYDPDGECDVPEPNSGFVAVAAGTNFSLGLKADGSVVGWGNNLYGQCDPPDPNRDFVAISAGLFHSVGLKADGTAVVWGSGEDIPLDPPSPPAAFTAVASGGSHILGLCNTDLPSGACCSPSEICAITIEANCYTPALWAGGDTVCDPNPCHTGACCRFDELGGGSTCSRETPSDCATLGGSYQGNGVACTVRICLTSEVSGATGPSNPATRSLPTPSAGGVRVEFDAPGAGEATLEVFNLSGAMVRKLVSKASPRGGSAFWWDGRDGERTPLPSGVYVTRVTAGKQVMTGRVVLSR
jgi:hypothetical protein